MIDLPQTPDAPIRGFLDGLSAAEAANLGEREIGGQLVRDIPKQLGRQFRKVQKASYDKDTRTVTMAVSSEFPVDRYFGQEVLSHKKGALRTDRLDGGVSLLFNHDYDLLLGRSVSYQLGEPMHVTCRFGTSGLAKEKEADVEAQILVDVSIGYVIHEADVTEDKSGMRSYLVTDWELLEVSLVTVPADPTVGVGRAVAEQVPLKVRSFRKEESAAVEAAVARATKTAAETGDEDDEDPDDEEAEGTGSEDERSAPNPSTTQPAEPTPTKRTTPMAEATVTVDLAAQHKERVASLRNIRRANPVHYTEEELFRDMDAETPVSQIASRVADKFIESQSRTDVKTAGDEVIGRMSEKEQKSYSLRNVYCAAINQRHKGTFSDKGADAGFEREVSESLKTAAAERGYREFGAGIVVPSQLPFSPARAAQQRNIAAGGPVGAVSIVPTIQADVIELLRSRTVCLALGARYMTGMFGTPRILRQNAAAQSNWLAEQGASVESDIGFDYIQMSPKRLSMQNGYFIEFLAQSPIAIEDMLRDDRNQVMARSLDTAGLFGTGANNQPLGLLGQTGLTSILTGSTRAANGTVTAGAGGVPATFVDVNNFESAISTQNGDIGTMGWALTPKVRAAMRSTPKAPGTANAAGFIWPDVSPVDGNGVQEGPLSYRANVTANTAFTGFTANAVPGLHAAFLGVWDQMLIGDWGLNEVINDNITGAPQGLFNIIEHTLHDINFRHIACFAASTSILPS